MAKEFDWSDKSKEKYYREAEKQISMLKTLQGVEVDRMRFGIRGNGIAIVHIKPVHYADCKRTIAMLKKQKNFKEEKGTYKGEYGYDVKRITFDGYFEITMEGKKNVPKNEKRSNRTRKCNPVVSVS